MNITTKEYISQTSIIGPASGSSPASVKLMIRQNGISIKRHRPASFAFLSLNLQQMPSISHRYRIDITAGTTPMKNISPAPIIRLREYRYGIRQMLKVPAPFKIPLLPSNRIGNTTAQAKKMEPIQIRDQVSFLFTARSQITHTAIPIRNRSKAHSPLSPESHRAPA